MKLSVVTTLYRSKPFLDTFLKEVLKAILELKISDFEVLFVNDGSPDDSLEFLLQKKNDIPQIKILDLTRNFGHHYAMQAGLKFAKGDYIFLIDNDLEVSPNIVVSLFDVLNSEKHIDVVYCYQDIRKGKFVERFSGKLFWKILNLISEVRVPENILTERLMKKEYVDNLLTLNDANLFLGGMMYWVGFNQKGVPVVKMQRQGKSTYSFRKRFGLMIQAITSFSGKPLELLFYLGLGISFLSFIFIVFLIIQKILMGDAVLLGWTSIVAINILILGIITTFLGLIGMYLFKIFKQVQGRPNYIVRKFYN